MHVTRGISTSAYGASVASTHFLTCFFCRRNTQRGKAHPHAFHDAVLALHNDRLTAHASRAVLLSMHMHDYDVCLLSLHRQVFFSRMSAASAAAPGTILENKLTTPQGFGCMGGTSQKPHKATDHDCGELCRLCRNKKNVVLSASMLGGQFLREDAAASRGAGGSAAGKKNGERA